MKIQTSLSALLGTGLFLVFAAPAIAADMGGMSEEDFVAKCADMGIEVSMMKGDDMMSDEDMGDDKMMDDGSMSEDKMSDGEMMDDDHMMSDDEIKQMCMDHQKGGM